MRNFAYLLIVVLLSPFTCRADMQKLIRETQQMAQWPHGITIAWWIPPEYWVESFKGNQAISAEQQARFVSVVKDYTIFAVVAVDVGPMGSFTPRNRESITPGIVFKVGNEVIPLLDNAALSSDLNNFVAIMKPMLANALGQMGKGIEFYIYSNNRKGNLLLSATGTTGFSYVVLGKEFKWRLPLASLLPSKFDPDTEEEFPGDYLFNPYSGKPLYFKKSPTKTPEPPPGAVH